MMDNAHRRDGPAFEGADGSREWFIHGKRHRTDGPAIDRSNGYKYWYENDKMIYSNVPRTFDVL